jgi:hypothetical protein
MKMTNVDTVQTFMQSGLSSFDPDAAVVFNDSGNDVDFRVESDSVTHALFVDGATGNVGVGDSDPSDAKLSVDGVLAGDVGLRIVNAQATDGLAIDQNGDGYALNIDSESTSLCTARINGKMPIIATQDISGGYAALFTRILDEAGSSPLVEIKDDHVSNTQTALKVRQDGTGLCADFVGDKIRAGEGILFGTDTADANALDDYEEGSWTPTYDGNSLTNEGTYRKIGKLVYVSTTLTNPPSTATFSTITGLPFSGSGWLHHGRSIGSDIDMNDHTYMAATTSINITKNSDGGGVSMTLLAALARIDIFGVYNAT